jgi:putative phage-type endonuclease
VTPARIAVCSTAVMNIPRVYEIVPLVERTPAWWEWRRSGIGSSDAAILLGEHPGRTVERLLLEKQQPARRSAQHFEADRSARQERQARAEYCRISGFTIAPTCVQNLARPWLRASLDGLSADGARAVEIKCGKATHASASARQRPTRQHVPQLQHILAATGLPAIDYWCYCPPHPPLRLEIKRDDTYIARLLAAEETFWRRLSAAPG